MNSPSPHGRHGPHPPEFHANGSTIPWAEVFAQHETLLSPHLDLLRTVKGHVVPDGEAFRTVSTMVNKTVQAMNQFKLVRKHILNKNSLESPGNAPRMNTQPPHTAPNAEPETKSRRKRSRTERDKDRASTSMDQMMRNDDPIEDAPTSKRKRDARSRPIEDPRSPETESPAQETEDISEEVQRRLRIKEERRRHKELDKPTKRKRESLMSNESASPNTARPKRKRVRSGEGVKDQQIGLEGDSDDSRKQRKKDRRTE
ncbi:hypothetical protein N7492_006319 [Penicillium capsulatum]|uniref:Uncharacterized protein n=1 Tax=Penicillium capsulatum TaxID=69766 RepID=A0A9W9I3B5_9EURO|nr:hypothetical protein N7492_006319 [Penicillium capsulatum]